MTKKERFSKELEEEKQNIKKGLDEIELKTFASEMLLHSFSLFDEEKESVSRILNTLKYCERLMVELIEKGLEIDTSKEEKDYNKETILFCELCNLSRTIRYNLKFDF